MKLLSSKKTLSFLLVLFLSLILIQCKPSKTREFEIYRFTDNLAEKSVIESPFKELLKKFNFVKQDLTREWTLLPSLSSKELDVWAVSSKLPILAFNEYKKPEGMKITRDGKEIEFVGKNMSQLNGWGWLQITKRKKLEQYKKFSKKLRGILIREGDSFRMEEILPDGDVSLNFHISKTNYKSSPPHLVVSFNKKPVIDIHLDKPHYFTVNEKLKLGNHKIEFKYMAPEGKTKKNKNNYILAKTIRILSHRDIIVLYSPKRKGKTPPPEKYKADYYSAFSESEEELDSVTKDALSIFALKEKYPIQDLGITNNPYSIAKKVQIDEYSHNCIFAPPKSQFMFEVKIPEKSFLEFGYGFLSESNKKINPKVNFKVEVEHKRKKNALFSKKLGSLDKVPFEKIDMAPYMNKKVKIYLTTETAAKKKNKPSEINNISSLWINPIIYKKVDKKSINFILVSIDTLRADHLSCYGYSKKTSPHLDSLSEDAVLFKNAFSTTSWTLPAHVSLLTSLNSPNHGMIYTLQKLNPNILTLADILRNNDYFCAAFTGGGLLNGKYGFSKGFDTYQHIIKAGDLSVRIDEAESLFRKTSEWLDRNNEKKFMLFLHTYQPHTPFENNSEVGKIFLSKNAKWKRITQGEIFAEKGLIHTVLSKEETDNVIALYDGEIRYTDEYLIKPMMNKLKELNIYDNTMIIITSDHGEEFYEHKSWLHGNNLYNESIQIPLIIKFPNSRYKGMKIENIVRIIDIMPTMLDAAKIDPSPFNLDGKSLLSMFRGDKEDRIFYCDLTLRKLHDREPSVFATNRNGLKFILNKKIRSPYTKKTSTEFEGNKIELYDIKKDFYETKSIAKKTAYKKLCKDLIEQIEKYSKSGGKTKAEALKMDEELKRSLKALGYIK